MVKTGKGEILWQQNKTRGITKAEKEGPPSNKGQRGGKKGMTTKTGAGDR